MFQYRNILTTLVVLFFCLITTSLFAEGTASLEKETIDAMKKATLFYRNKVSTQGGYLFEYTVDMKHRYGEMPARKSQIWVQDPSTPAMGQLYLDAYEATGDPVYLEAADAAARALIRGQLECGGWNYLIDFKAGSLDDWYKHEGHHPDYNEFSHFEGNATFDDGVTYAPTMLLLRLYDMTSDPAYLGPLSKALDFVLEAQYPIGGWTQRYPVTGTGYDTYFTYNDGVINSNIELMMHAYKILVKPKYLESIRCGGNFIILSQRPGPQYGWGQQHSQDLELAPGRALEPASVSPPETLDNINTLIDIYELTGDRRYLETVSKSLDWLDSIVQEDGSVPRYIEEGTGRPMAAKYVGDSGSYESIQITYDLSEAFGGYGFVIKRFSTKPARERYERLVSMPWQGTQEKPSPPQVSDTLNKAKVMEQDIRRIIDALDDQGRWTEDGRMYTERFCYKNIPEHTGPVMKNGWIRTRTFIRNLKTLIEYITLLNAGK